MKRGFSIKAIVTMFQTAGQKIQAYSGFLLFLLLAAIYAFTIVQISRYSNPSVSGSEVSSKVAASPTPRIDENAASKLRSLNDNSVNVQTLFDESRTNPFQE